MTFKYWGPSFGSVFLLARSFGLTFVNFISPWFDILLGFTLRLFRLLDGKSTASEVGSSAVDIAESAAPVLDVLLFEEEYSTSLVDLQFFEGVLSSLARMTLLAVFSSSAKEA